MRESIANIMSSLTWNLMGYLMTLLYFIVLGCIALVAIPTNCFVLLKGFLTDLRKRIEKVVL